MSNSNVRESFTSEKVYVSVSPAIDIIGRLVPACASCISIPRTLSAQPGGEADGEIAAFAGSLFEIGPHTTVHGSIGRAFRGLREPATILFCPVTSRGSHVLEDHAVPNFRAESAVTF